MKTRNLLLLALGCGLAILLAGVGMFWRLSNQTSSTTAAINTPTKVGDMTVTVGETSEVEASTGAPPGSAAAITVVVSLRDAADDVPAENFKLFVDGETFEPVESDCPAVIDAEVRCRIGFEIGGDAPGARLLSYRRGDDRATWVLP